MSTAPARIIIDCELSLFSCSASVDSIKLKDPALQRVLIALHKKYAFPIIMITTNPHTQIIATYLAHILPKESFQVLYVPPLNKNKAPMKISNPIIQSPATNSPPLGYSVLINHTNPPPKEGWGNYLASLRQRLLNTGAFITIESNSDEECIADEEKILMPPAAIPRTEQTLKQPVPKKPLVYDTTSSYSPVLWKCIETEGKGRRSASPLQRLVDSSDKHPQTPPRPN